MPKDLFSKIKDFQHHLAILAAYTIDNDVIEKLREHSVARMYVMHDMKQGVHVESTYGGRLCVRPARPTASAVQNSIAKFHPKVVLLVGKEKVAIGVGSANLSVDSFRKPPKETYAWVEIDRNNTELMILTRWLQRFAIQGWETVFKEVMVSEVKKTQEETWKFLHNEKEPIGQQIIRVVQKNWNYDTSKAIVHVVSPFLSADAKEPIMEWFKLSGALTIIAYARKNRSAEVFADTGVTVKFPEPGKKKEGFHSKQVMFEWPKKNTAVLYVGSANFTKQGFFLSEDKGGNSECGMLMVLHDEQYKKWKKEWFESGWDAGRRLGQEKLEELPEIDKYDDTPKPYCWAETSIDEKTITLWVACADGQKIKIVKPRIVRPIFVQDKHIDLFQCSIKRTLIRIDDDEDVFVHVNVGGRAIKVPVLIRADFGNAYQQDGAGIFGIEYVLRRRKPLYSIQDIKTQRIEPGDNVARDLKSAALDEFHKIWKRRFENFGRRSYFCAQHLDELKNIMNGLSPSEQLYITSHLKKHTPKFNDRELVAYLANLEKIAAEQVFGATDVAKWYAFTQNQEV